jgi:hypothetical protein
MALCFLVSLVSLALEHRSLALLTTCIVCIGCQGALLPLNSNLLPEKLWLDCLLKLNFHLARALTAQTCLHMLHKSTSLRNDMANCLKPEEVLPALTIVFRVFATSPKLTVLDLSGIKSVASFEPHVVSSGTRAGPRGRLSSALGMYACL